MKTPLLLFLNLFSVAMRPIIVFVTKGIGFFGSQFLPMLAS
jgi:hypothetical protein